jgi:hypothetical protein
MINISFLNVRFKYNAYLSLLKFPDLHIAKSYISGIGVVFREDANLARFVCIVTYGTDVLFIDVEVHIASPGNDCKQIAVACILMNGRTVAVGQFRGVIVVLRDEKVIDTITFKAEDIKFCRCAIRPKNQSPIVTPGDGHLHLIGQVAKVCVLGKAREVEPFRI